MNVSDWEDVLSTVVRDVKAASGRCRNRYMTFVKTAAYQFQQLRLKKMAEEHEAEQVHIVILCLCQFNKILGFDRYRVSADTGQYWSVSVSADTYLSIGADTSSPVVRWPVSTVNTVATHAYSFSPVPYFHASILHTYITCTHLYPAQNRIFSTKNCTAQYRYRYWYRHSCGR